MIREPPLSGCKRRLRLNPGGWIRHVRYQQMKLSALTAGPIPPLHHLENSKH